MRLDKQVWVEYNDHSIVRIFKSKTAAFASNKAVAKVSYGYAVSDIRYQLWMRSEGLCENCCAMVTKDSGHMHERKWRGKGGDISLENSIFICPTCHKHAHKERSIKPTRRKQ